MRGATGRRVPLAWVLLAGIAAIGIALAVASGRALNALLWLAILACPLLHLLGGHRHGLGHEHPSGERGMPEHVHGPTAEGASAATPPQTVGDARGTTRPA